MRSYSNRLVLRIEQSYAISARSNLRTTWLSGPLAGNHKIGYLYHTRFCTIFVGILVVRR